MNRKGFMMAELVVVSSVVLVTLVGLYASFNRIYSTYKTRLTYYDTTTLYRLGYYRDILIQNDMLDDVMNDSLGGIVTVYDVNDSSNSIIGLPNAEKPNNVEDKVFMINNKKSKINKDMFNEKNIHPTFLDYVDYIGESVDFSKFDYMMIMERCNKNSDNIVNEDDCSYAYLEILEPLK